MLALRVLSTAFGFQRYSFSVCQRFDYTLLRDSDK